LKFNLGIITRRMPQRDSDSSRPARYFRWIQVWRVDPDVDENRAVKGLRAERLACFPEQHCNNRCLAFRLQGPQVSYSLRTVHNEWGMAPFCCIVVVDWTIADWDSLVYPRRVLFKRTADYLALLPGNKILCHFSFYLCLFDLDDASITTLDPSQYPSLLTQIDPVAQLKLVADAISAPYFFQHFTRFSVSYFHGVRGVVIPHSNGTSQNAIELIDLLSTPFLDTQCACIGYDRVLLWDGRRLITQECAWPEDPSRDLVIKTAIDWDSGWPKVLFDESSGRILLSVFKTKKQLILGI